MAIKQAKSSKPKSKLEGGPEGFTPSQIKQINNDIKQREVESTYAGSHTITTIDDVKKRLEGLKKSEEFNKNLSYKKDNLDHHFKNKHEVMVHNIGNKI